MPRTKHIKFFKRVDDDMLTICKVRAFLITFHLFKDCGEWFLYIIKGEKFIRISPAGNIYRWR